MARPITWDGTRGDAREALRKRIDEAPLEHAEALLDAYELLQQLHEAGVLRLMRGAVSAGDHMVDAAVGAAQSAEAIRAARNAIVLGKMLSAINPEILEGIAVAVGETLGSYKKPVIEPPGMLSLLSQFRHKELRSSVALINRFLESLGQQIKLQGDPQKTR